MSSLKPGAEVHRFNASDLRICSDDCLAAALQNVAGLKKVAGEIMSCGLVHVDENNRAFGMHQLVQRAVGTELVWQLQYKRMQSLLHARFGQFGDENYFDTRLYGVMREMLPIAVKIVQKARYEGVELGEAWCTCMMLRLHEVARDVCGEESKLSVRTFVVAHGSVVADVIFEHMMQKYNGKNYKSLNEIAAVPYIQDVIQKSRDAHFNIQQCLATFWSADSHASLVVHLVRRFVINKGSMIPCGKVMPIESIAAVGLIRDIVNVRPDFDLAKCLHDASSKWCGGRLVVEAGGSIACYVQCDTLKD